MVQKLCWRVCHCLWPHPRVAGRDKNKQGAVAPRLAIGEVDEGVQLGCLQTLAGRGSCLSWKEEKQKGVQS